MVYPYDLEREDEEEGIASRFTTPEFSVTGGLATLAYGLGVPMKTVVSPNTFSRVEDRQEEERAAPSGLPRSALDVSSPADVLRKVQAQKQSDLQAQIDAVKAQSPASEMTPHENWSKVLIAALPLALGGAIGGKLGASIGAEAGVGQAESFAQRAIQERLERNKQAQSLASLYGERIKDASSFEQDALKTGWQADLQRQRDEADMARERYSQSQANYREQLRQQNEGSRDELQPTTRAALKQSMKFRAAQTENPEEKAALEAKMAAFDLAGASEARLLQEDQRQLDVDNRFSSADPNTQVFDLISAARDTPHLQSKIREAYADVLAQNPGLTDDKFISFGEFAIKSNIPGTAESRLKDLLGRMAIVQATIDQGNRPSDSDAKAIRQEYGSLTALGAKRLLDSLDFDAKASRLKAYNAVRARTSSARVGETAKKLLAENADLFADLNSENGGSPVAPRSKAWMR